MHIFAAITHLGFCFFFAGEMASHVACLSSDIEPHSFPPPRPTARDHGVMSQYEQVSAGPGQYRLLLTTNQVL